MADIEIQTAEPPVAPPPRRRRRRWLLWGLAALGLLVVGVAIVYWAATRPPKPVSVNDVIDKFRHSSPAPSHAAVGGGGPAVGVYVYATRGTERISTGNVTHHYPARTTLTVTSSSCGLDLRWDALAGRWARWQVCRTPTGWRLDHYTDVHKFLYMQDVHDYTCNGFPVVVCRPKDGVLTSTVQRVGTERISVGGTDVTTTHLRIEQVATGKSVSNGTIDAWVLPTGLPARVHIRDHGYSVVLGSHVDYYESATFDLISTTPRR